MLLPTVHLNGTSAQALFDANRRAAAAVHDAIAAMSEAYPNGRDFYPQGANAINVAMEEHRTRVRKLEEVAKDLEEIALHCLYWVS